MKRLRFLLTVLFSALFTIALVTACNPNSSTTGTSGRPTLTMATSADYPPYEFVNSASGNQEIVGFDVDIARHITDQLGYDLKIDNIDFNGLVPALQSKRADFVMAGMTPTAERKQNVDFSDIYYEAKNTLISKKTDNFTSPDQLKGKTVGVQLGSIQEGAAKKFEGVDVKPLNRISEMIQELKAGRVSALVVEDTVAKGFVESNPDLVFNVIPNTEEAGSAIAFPKGSELRDKFNPILQEMQSSGKMTELVNKWFGENSPASQQPKS